MTLPIAKGDSVMAEFLLELFSEEIPARMQARAAADLERLMAEALKAANLVFTAMRSFATPRRLTLVVSGLPATGPDVAEEKRGPRVDAPEAALAGFRASLPDDAVIDERAEKKGRFLFATIRHPGRASKDALAEIVPAIIRAFPWPKSMRSGVSDLRWVRPLLSILAILDGETVPFAIDGIASGNRTTGHRFLAPDVFAVGDFADYKAKLEAAHVLLDPEDRKNRILEGARALAAAEGLELIEDPALVAENAGLTEWPVPLLGRFDADYLETPDEVLMTAMKVHQKYFSLHDPKTGRLAPRFICVANTQAADGGAKIVAGNERVLSARLSDARFFWRQDVGIALADRLPALVDIVFHEKLGSLADRVARIEALAVHLAETVDFGSHGGKTPHPDPLLQGERGKAGVLDTPRPSGEREGPVAQQWEGEGRLTLIEQIRRAARLAKADLTTGLVGEFPELQGLIGRRLAEAQGEPEAVARAIEEHYAPKGPEDRCPSDPVSVCVALAEKIDTLVGFFAIDEKPTGSKDPFALRRAALGVIRLIVENGLRIKLNNLFIEVEKIRNRPLYGEGLRFPAVAEPLLVFFADRLKVQSREKGVRHDLIDAVFSLGGEDDLVRLLARVAALQGFVATGDGVNLLAGYKRAGNILKIEGKRDGRADWGAVDPTMLEETPEIALHAALGTARAAVEPALKSEDFTQAMRALAALRAPIDGFFDAVTVNADDPALRSNRLALLEDIRRTIDALADFSKIEG